MIASGDMVLVVKHTFLEFVVQCPGGPTGRSRTRTMSDTGFNLPASPQHVSQFSFAVCTEPKGFSDDMSSISTNDVDSEDERRSSAACSRRLSSWADESLSDDELPEDKTTVIFRNVPNDFTRDMLLQLFDDEGFAGKYDFVYLPIDFKSNAGFGYAFVNLVDGLVANSFRNRFNGFGNWSMPSQKVAEVAWSNPSQGLEVHVDRYRNSPIMHNSVLDLYKPAMFQNGDRIPFPPPTKAIKAPRARPNKRR